MFGIAIWVLRTVRGTRVLYKSNTPDVHDVHGIYSVHVLRTVKGFHESSTCSASGPAENNRKSTFQSVVLVQSISSVIIGIYYPQCSIEYYGILLCGKAVSAIRYNRFQTDPPAPFLSAHRWEPGFHPYDAISHPSHNDW